MRRYARSLATTVSVAALLLSVLAACSGDDGPSGDDVAPDVVQNDAVAADVAPGDVEAPDGSASDVALDDAVDVPSPADVPADAAADVPPDVAADVPPDVPVDPVPFRVGVSRDHMATPLGMGVSGSGPAPPGGHVSPFSIVYPATDRALSPITVKAIALEGGYGRMVFVRLDALGITKELRRSVALELATRGAGVAEQDLLFVATHTHAAPARLVNKGNLWNMIADVFWPQHYDRVVAGIADVVESALADLEPARFGYAFGYTDEAHNDRRCENPELLDGTMPVLRFDRADGTPKAAIVIYAIHGTVVGTGTYSLSSDTGGAIEYKTAERMGAPVEVMFVNSWAGDVSPADPRGPRPEGPLPALDADTDRLEAIGNDVADAVMEIWGGIETNAEVDVDHAAALVELSREAIGYGEGEFPYNFGAVYCGGADSDGVCFGSGDPLPDPDGIIASCGIFKTPEEGVTSTWLSVYRIGDLLVPTFPGEPVTQVAHNVIDGIRETTAWDGDIAFVGYAQDYTGYSETEEHWWYGGYETSGALWGPRQGDYLTAEALALVGHFVDPEGVPLAVHAATDFVVPPVKDEPLYRTTWETEPSLTAEVVLEEPAEAPLPHDIVRVTWAGGDPWIDHPLVTLEVQDETSGAWAPFLRDDGTPLANDRYEFHLGLATDPPYSQTKRHTERTFSWWAELPLMRIQPTTTAPLVGTFRLRIEGRHAPAEGEEATYDVASRPFTVTPPQ